jgi:hypothetical protein
MGGVPLALVGLGAHSVGLVCAGIARRGGLERSGRGLVWAHAVMLAVDVGVVLLLIAFIVSGVAQTS